VGPGEDLEWRRGVGESVEPDMDERRTVESRSRRQGFTCERFSLLIRQFQSGVKCATKSDPSDCAGEMVNYIGWFVIETDGNRDWYGYFDQKQNRQKWKGGERQAPGKRLGITRPRRSQIRILPLSL
jgi:hypothetical protein